MSETKELKRKRNLNSDIDDREFRRYMTEIYSRMYRKNSILDFLRNKEIKKEKYSNPFS